MLIGIFCQRSGKISCGSCVLSWITFSRKFVITDATSSCSQIIGVQEIRRNLLCRKSSCCHCRIDAVLYTDTGQIIISSYLRMIVCRTFYRYHNRHYGSAPLPVRSHCHKSASPGLRRSHRNAVYCDRSRKILQIPDPAAAGSRSSCTLAAPNWESVAPIPAFHVIEFRIGKYLFSQPNVAPHNICPDP